MKIYTDFTSYCISDNADIALFINSEKVDAKKKTLSVTFQH